MAQAPKKPGAVIFVAVILILTGSWNILGGICGGGMFAILENVKLPQAPGQEDPLAQHRFMVREAPGYLAFLYSAMAIDALLGIFKIIAGIGLLRMSATARVLALLVVSANFLVGMAAVAYNVAVALPAHARFVDAHPQHAGTFISTIVVLVISVLLQVLLALTILVILNKAATREAFAAAAAPPSDEDDDRPRSRYEGYDDEPPTSTSTETGITDRPY